MLVNLKHLQTIVDSWIRANGGYWPPLAMIDKLHEETYEVEEEIKNYLAGGLDITLENLGKELADVMFAVICIANEYKINLGTAFLNKMKER